jgi:diguanylate cyclase (GGDEF)-like protein
MVNIQNTSHSIELELLREENSLLNILSQYATALLSLTTTGDVLRYTTDQVVGRMGFNDCVIYLWNESTQRLDQQFAFGHKSTKQGDLQNALSLRFGEGIVGSAAKNLKTIVINDLSQHDDYIMDVELAASELAIPIIHGDELIGVIDSESKIKGFYTEDRIKIMDTVTAMLSAKLAQTILIDRLEKTVFQLESSEKIQKILFKISSLIYEDENLFSIYDKLHSLVGQLFNAKSFFIAIFNAEKKQVDFPYYVDEHEPEIGVNLCPSDKLMEGMSAWIIFNNNQPMLLSKEDVIERVRLGDFKVFGGVPESWLGVPIQTEDVLDGALVVQSYNPDISYNEKDKELLIFVSHHVNSLLSRKIIEKKLHYQALHDALTGLANRTLFLNRIAHSHKRNARKKYTCYAIMYMDIDYFKSINDAYGHHVGDALLIEFAKLLKHQARESDTVARLGGDEFAIFLESLDYVDSAQLLATRILNGLKNPFMILNHEILVTSSIGIAVISDALISVDEGIRRADVAMYKAKLNGRCNYQVYDANEDI